MKINFREKIFSKIKKIVFWTLESAKKKINKNQKQNCFEIFGFDFMIDSEMNLWLIEVNTNPCLEESSPLLCQLIPRMIGNINLN